MGFLDKAKAAADQLAAKADDALNSSGLAGPASSSKEADRFFRDLGVLAYLESTGRPADGAARERVTASLTALEQQGALTSFALQTSAPPPPGAAAAPPPSSYTVHERTAPPAPAPPPFTPPPPPPPPPSSL